MCKNSIVIRHSVKELLAKNSVTRQMEYIVVVDYCPTHIELFYRSTFGKKSTCGVVFKNFAYAICDDSVKIIVKNISK